MNLYVILLIVAITVVWEAYISIKYRSFLLFAVLVGYTTISTAVMYLFFKAVAYAINYFLKVIL